jgi:hypothetical protein
MSLKRQEGKMKQFNTASLRTAIILLCCSLCSNLVLAIPVQQQDVQQAVHGWLKQNPTPMEQSISKNTGTIQSVSEKDGLVLYHVVPLQPCGFVILSADDEIEPVIAFSTTGNFDGAEDNPLKILLERDMKGRLEAIGQNKANQNMTLASGENALQQKWRDLVSAGAEEKTLGKGDIQLAGLLSVSDVRVSPFLLTKWDQGDAAGVHCYNYYTNFGTGTYYPTGCVATAMAQVMRYHSWPTVAIGVHSFQITVAGVVQWWNTRGGNGSGGAYDWVSMVYDPQAGGLTTAQRQAIGALCYDAGLSVNMSYTSGNSSASSATADTAFTNTFLYSNSIYGIGFSSSGDAGLWAIMNADLDAALPVILGIDGPSGGHAVVADGYGYNSSTMYHHLNMGWGGDDDAWYQLPTIDAYYTFNAITDCIYNIYPSGTGEIISGRITSMAGAPLEGVAVTAYQGSTFIQQVTSNSRGIYALKNIASNTTYRLSAVKSGYIFVDQYVTTGRSQDRNAAGGNKWGINFAATNPMPPTALDKVVDANSLASKRIMLDAVDDHLPNPPGKMSFTITSLPAHGALSELNVGPINITPYTLAVDANSVQYTPCPYFGGQDSFTFKANDGGTPPSGGDSNIATITVNVDNKLYANYATDSTTYTEFMMNTASYYDMRSQVIYLQNDIGSAKYITDLALNIYTVPGRTLTNWTIRMQHTNWTYFNSPTTMFLTSGWNMVYQGDVTITQPGWYNFHFQTPFQYNGTQNLLVDFSYNNSGITSPAGGYFINPSVGTNRVLSLVSTTGTQGDPLTWNFWSLGGSYYTGYVPSVKLIGTVPIDPVAGDFDASCDVKLPDMAILSAAWMTQQGQAGYNPACDISSPKDNTVNLSDLIVFAAHWLQTYQP